MLKQETHIAESGRVQKQIVIVGGGFAGIHAAKQFAGSDVTVSVIDAHNYHLFQPLLYQVATAGLSPADIAYPIRSIFRAQKNVQVYLGKVQSVDLPSRTLRLDTGEFGYDYLVLAAGSTHSYFGHDEWQIEAPGLKTVEDATEIRKRILLAFEEAEHEADEASRLAKLTFVVVGGGPTGVELAGALKEIACQSIPNDYRNIDTAKTRIILVQAGDRVLPSFPEKLSQAALDNLRLMGVEVLLNSKVTNVDADGVRIGEQFLPAQNIFWAAGVQASPLGKSLGVPLDPSGRVAVLPDLSLPGHPEVFVVGDMAAITDPETKKMLPGVAQVAIQSGEFVGKVIEHELRVGPAEPTKRGTFRYHDKGNMATIGRLRAVAQIGKWNFHGFFAWILWSVVHVLFLVGFRNRIVVSLNWLWNFATFKRSARLITGSAEYSVRRFRYKYGLPLKSTDSKENRKNAIEAA